MEQLKAAVHFGADAVYLAGTRFGLRKRAGAFDADAMREAVAIAHAAGVKVHVTVNALMHEGDIDGEGSEGALSDCLREVEASGADAVIAGDLATIALARREAPRLEVHASTQLSCANHVAAEVLYNMGCSRVVLARELSLSEIARIREKAPAELELEAFCHGAMCMAVSGRCMISNHLNGRDANRGHCTQPCRWVYTLEEEKRPGVHFPIEEDERGTTILSSKDLMMLEHLGEMRDAGVASIKIEGRAKSAFYVATVVNAYRHVLDGADPALYLPELDAVSHRAYHTGFFFGQPDQSDANREYFQEKILVGTVSAARTVDDGCEVEFQLRNRVAAGERIEVLSPGKPVRAFELGRAYNLGPIAEGWVSELSRSSDRYRTAVPFEVAEGDILRRACTPEERNRDRF